MDGEYNLAFETNSIVVAEETVIVRGGMGFSTRRTLGAGSYRAVVSFAGNGEYLPARRETEFAVYKGNPEFSIEATPDETTVGGTVTIVPSLPDDAGGKIRYSMGDSILGEYPVGETPAVSATSLGTFVIEALYLGDGNYNFVSTDTSFVVLAAP